MYMLFMTYLNRELFRELFQKLPLIQLYMSVECLNYMVLLCKVYLYKQNLDFAISKKGIALTHAMNGADFLFNLWGWTVVTSAETQKLFGANQEYFQPCQSLL